MKIKVVANNCNWNSLNDKLRDVKEWFKPLVDIEFSVTHVQFNDVPFKFYNNADVVNSENNVNGVTPEWYDKNVLPYGIGSDMVLFLMNLEQWKGGNARGWRTDSDQGPIELQAACSEDEQIIWPNFPSMSAFFQIVRHEIMHGLFMITGQTDTTHFYWNQGKLEIARDSIRLPENYSLPIIVRALNYIISLFIQIKAQVPPPVAQKEEIKDEAPKAPVETAQEKLFRIAKEFLGTDASPDDRAPDEFGCAESVNQIYKKAFGVEIGGGESTYQLYLALRKHPLFKLLTIKDPIEPGDVVISPTGYGGSNEISHGHCGIVGEDGHIMSNESKSGKFEVNYTMESWRARYQKLGGYPVLFFRRV
jgi:hypothetical protein